MFMCIFLDALLYWGPRYGTRSLLVARRLLTVRRAPHHIDRAKFGDIKYTEPFLNNQHITEPTLYYLENRLR